jgi:resolvase-like protein
MREDISGKNQQRSLRPQQLVRLTAVLAKGDVLVVTRLDGLARSTRDLLNPGIALFQAERAEEGIRFKPV